MPCGANILLLGKNGTLLMMNSMKNNPPLEKQSQDWQAGFKEGRAVGFNLAWKWHTIFLDAKGKEHARQIRAIKYQHQTQWAALSECERTTSSE